MKQKRKRTSKKLSSNMGLYSIGLRWLCDTWQTSAPQSLNLKTTTLTDTSCSTCNWWPIPRQTHGRLDNLVQRSFCVLRPANERWRYTVTPSLIGWVHTHDDPCWPTWNFAENILNYICMTENWYILFEMHQLLQKLVSKDANYHNSPMVLAWCQMGNKPLSEPKIAQLTDAHIHGII